MSHPRDRYFTTNPDGSKQLHWLTCKKADGSEIRAKDYEVELKTNAESRRLKRLEAKEAGKRLCAHDLPQPDAVYCKHEICGARKHLTNKPQVEGAAYVHRDANIPNPRLRFVHFGINSKFSPNPNCPDYKQTTDLFAALENKHRKQSRKLVLAKLRNPKNRDKADVQLKEYFGLQTSEFMRKLRKKNERDLADIALLRTHHELFGPLAALHTGYHPHFFKTTGRTHQVIYRPVGEQRVRYRGLDGKIHTRFIAKKIQLWFKYGFGGRPARPVQNGTFDVVVKEWHKKPAPANDNTLPISKKPGASPWRNDHQPKRRSRSKGAIAGRFAKNLAFD